MRIMGIDPGYAIVGVGIVDYHRNRFSTLEYGAITTTPDQLFPKRLQTIYEDYTTLLDRFHPEAVSIEKLYFGNNVTTGIDVAQARGLILLGAAQRNIPIFEYSPVQIKQAVVGYGNAEKHQVIYMTTKLLNLKQVPKPDDVADALAVAITHAHCCGIVH